MCTHALTTEAEEVMGLLLGDIRVSALLFATARAPHKQAAAHHSRDADCSLAGRRRGHAGGAHTQGRTADTDRQAKGACWQSSHATRHRGVRKALNATAELPPLPFSHVEQQRRQGPAGPAQPPSSFTEVSVRQARLQRAVQAFVGAMCTCRC